MFDFITSIEDVQLALIICGTAVALIFIIFQPHATRVLRDALRRAEEAEAEAETWKGKYEEEHTAYLDAAFGENRVTKVPVERYAYDYNSGEYTVMEDIRR